MIINCIIVDDEPASREILEKYVSECTQLHLSATCKNALEANAILLKEAIDLIFLDINMPKLSGLNFYKSLSNRPMVIFTTAYPEYAVEGFEVDAIDYLLKPFSFERFFKAVNKALNTTNQSNEIQERHITLKADKKLYRICVDDINYLEALGDYVKIDYADQNIMVHITFKNLLSLIENSDLLRVHKSFAVSLSKFDHIEGNQIKIKGRSIPIGSTFKQNLLDQINH